MASDYDLEEGPDGYTQFTLALQVEFQLQTLGFLIQVMEPSMKLIGILTREASSKL